MQHAVWLGDASGDSWQESAMLCSNPKALASLKYGLHGRNNQESVLNFFYEFHNPPFYKSSSDPLEKLEKPTLGVKGNYSPFFLILLDQFCS